MADINKAVYDSKQALPNKLLQSDGTVTDLAGNSTIGAVDAYINKPALPNKWLNPDGSYSTLNEIVAGLIDTDIFVVVDTLPATGETDKIYLLVQDSKLIEYLWVNGAWDPVGMVEFDINNYYTKSEVTQLISASLNSAKAYTDTQIANINIDPQIFYWTYHTPPMTQEDLTFWNNVMEVNKTSPVMIVFKEPISGTKYNIYHGYADIDGIRNDSNHRVKCYPTLPTTSGGGSFPYAVLAFKTKDIIFTIVNDEITAVQISDMTIESDYLHTTAVPSSGQAFIPTKDWQPTTKKYVDDSISTNITNVLNGSY